MLGVEPTSSTDANTDGGGDGTPKILITSAHEGDGSHISQRSNPTPQHIVTPPEINPSVSCECATEVLPKTTHTNSPLLVRKDTSFKVLCIDGGGFCCLSAILTLIHLLGTVNHGKSEDSPRPCDHFDLICGVGSGGLVAILFGILEMRCDEAMDVYVRLGRLAFEEREIDGKIHIAPRGRDRTAFRKELERLVAERFGAKDAIMKSATGLSSCRVSSLNSI